VWNAADRGAPPRRVGAPESLRREVDASLRRLGVEQIDLYQMHWPAEDGTKLEDYWQTFVELKAAGKVRAIGLSNHDVDQLERAEAVGHVDVLQPPFSAIHRDTARTLLPWTTAHRTGVIVHSPATSGLLTGAFSADHVASLPADDWRRYSSDFTTNLAANLAVSDALDAVARRHGVAESAAAVAWVLAFAGVTGAIVGVGARSPAQVDGWLPGMQLALTDRDLDEVAAAIAASGAGEGPVRPIYL
jgi:aryl-alcohol dehydrogenase-like predicted oxidoreductase